MRHPKKYIVPRPAQHSGEIGISKTNLLVMGIVGWTFTSFYFRHTEAKVRSALTVIDHNSNVKREQVKK
jgi:hypothetical protein